MLLSKKGVLHLSPWVGATVKAVRIGAAVVQLIQLHCVHLVLPLNKALAIHLLRHQQEIV